MKTEQKYTGYYFFLLSYLLLVPPVVEVLAQGPSCAVCKGEPHLGSEQRPKEMEDGCEGTRWKLKSVRSIRLWGIDACHGGDKEVYGPWQYNMATCMMKDTSQCRGNTGREIYPQVGGLHWRNTSQYSIWFLTNIQMGRERWGARHSRQWDIWGLSWYNYVNIHPQTLT